MDPFKFPDNCFGFRLGLVDEFTEIIPIAFGPIISYHQGLFASVKIFFQVFGVFFGLISRVSDNGPGDQGSIPGRVIPKTQKMLLDAVLLSTQHYKVMIKCKVEQSWEKSSALPYTLV